MADMAEPLKNSFGHEIPDRIAVAISNVDSAFDGPAFIAFCLEGYDDLELTPRARRISDGLARLLPADRGQAMQIIMGALGTENTAQELTGMESFVYLPYVFFVADHGLDHFETAMSLQYDLTKRFTAEFSIRSYIENHYQQTMDRLRIWATDDNVHVRRLVSEGTRPRLPWAPRLTRFVEDPDPVIDLLDLLKDDPEEYVRRSVANNLNDIAKDHPHRVTELAKDWWNGASRDRKRLLRHGLRTLIKAGNADALDILGYTANTPVAVGEVTIEPASAVIGDKIRISVNITNPSESEAPVLVDFRIHFVKANGATSPKVFKGAERAIKPGEDTTVGKTISLAQHSTRTHYPGTHSVEVVVNGVTHPGSFFEVSPLGLSPGAKRRGKGPAAGG